MTTAPPTGDIARLWDEVLASPDDDGARAVLADLLQVAGDPRGELISLQLLSIEDAAALDRQDRIQQLLRSHVGEWLGPLRDIARAARFDRGFLSALELDMRWPATSPEWKRPLADRTLLTVTELPNPLSPVGDTRGEIYARFMTSPVMSALRRVEVCDLESVIGLEACPARLTHVACTLRPTDPKGALIGERILPECERRATVTSLAMFVDTFPLVATSRWFERLSTITVACDARRGLALWPRMPPGAALVVVPTPGIERCTVAFPLDYRIEIAHEAGTLIARVAGEWVLQPLLALTELPREVSRIEIEYTSELMARRVSETVARPGVEVIVRAPRRAGNLRWA